MYNQGLIWEQQFGCAAVTIQAIVQFVQNPMWEKTPREIPNQFITREVQKQIKQEIDQKNEVKIYIIDPSLPIDKKHDNKS